MVWGNKGGVDGSSWGITGAGLDGVGSGWCVGALRGVTGCYAGGRGGARLSLACTNLVGSDDGLNR